MASEGFVGRQAELGHLDSLLRRVAEGRRDVPGTAVMLRGRRRVGKSRLVEVFCQRSGVPYVYFQASSGADPDAERAAFGESVAESALPGRDLFATGVSLSTWAAVFRQLAAALPETKPSIVVIDELPWLMQGDAALEGILQTSWDTLLSRKPVLLILIGSDLAMMERLDDYRRPFHQRGTVMVLRPLNPAEIGSMLELGPAAAIDAYLITGGLPLICQDWEPGLPAEHFLATMVPDPTSSLLVSGERSLAAEFPAQLQARNVLSAIGTGERTWSGIRAAMSSGVTPMAASSLATALQMLETKRIVTAESPLSTQPAEKERRYRVADPYLRFYLAFLSSGLPLIERGRADLVLRRIERSFGAWRGRAVEPVVREAVLRLAPELGFDAVEAVGGWWNRQNNPEVDLIGADRERTTTRIIFAGSIKWHDHRPFDRHDEMALIRDVGYVPGAGTATELIAVSRSGADQHVQVRILTPADLLRGWTP
jgi:uncharacterized protein